MMPFTGREAALQFWGMAGMRDAIHFLLEEEYSIRHAEALGVTKEQAKEVIQVWSEWYSNTPWPMNWAYVREAIKARSENEAWRP